MKFLKPTIIFLAFFVGWLLLIYSLWTSPILLTVILLIISLVYFRLLKEKQGLTFFVAAAIFGPIGEAIISSGGLWTYHGQTILGIPYWLPLAWGITTVALHKYLIHLKSRKAKP